MKSIRGGKAICEMAANMRHKQAARAREQRDRRAARPEPVSLAHALSGPTAERVAHAGDCHELADGRIDRAGERIPVTRKFRDSPIDRMHRQGSIGAREHRAAEWYLSTYERAGIEQRVIARYGDCTGGESDDTRRHAARIVWRKARAAIPANMIDMVDNCVLHRVAPAFANGQQRGRYAEMIGKALSPLADFLGC